MEEEDRDGSREVHHVDPSYPHDDSHEVHHACHRGGCPLSFHLVRGGPHAVRRESRCCCCCGVRNNHPDVDVGSPAYRFPSLDVDVRPDVYPPVANDSAEDFRTAVAAAVGDHDVAVVVGDASVSYMETQVR